MANEIDSNDNPYKAIVSVLMLKEGWDVRNVTTIVGLRTYGTPSKILPEQTLGRGLRRMYFGSDQRETVSLVGTPAFMEFVESIESEGVNLGRSSDRLQKAYYYRWLRNPPSIDPQTKMPRFFTDDTKSPLTDILDGDVQKQLDAIWNYLSLGEKMVPPPGPDGK